VTFAASGFKTSDVSGVKINVSESPVLNKVIEIGAQTEQVAVETNTETVQTASSSWAL